MPTSSALSQGPVARSGSVAVHPLLGDGDAEASFRGDEVLEVLIGVDDACGPGTPPGELVVVWPGVLGEG